MSQQQPNATTNQNGAGAAPPDKKPSTAKLKPLKSLPTARVRVPKQLEILRAYGVGSKFGAQPMRYTDVAKLVGIDPNTTSLCNNFFYDCGLIVRNDGGALPSEAVIEFARAYEWSPDEAPYKLAPKLQNTWFGQVMTLHLRMRDMSEKDALSKLAEISGASPEYRPSLKMLLEYLALTGIISRSGDLIRLGAQGTATPRIEPDEQPDDEMATDSPPVSRERPRQTTAPAIPHVGDGAIQFHFSVKVTMADLATWDPQRIAAFFAGMAKVISAKNGGDFSED